MGGFIKDSWFKKILRLDISQSRRMGETETCSFIKTSYLKWPASDYLRTKPKKEFKLWSNHEEEERPFHLRVSNRQGIPVDETSLPDLEWTHDVLHGEGDKELAVLVAWCPQVNCHLVKSTADSGQGHGEFEIFFRGNMGAASHWFVGRVVCPWRPDNMEEEDGTSSKVSKKRKQESISQG